MPGSLRPVPPCIPAVREIDVRIWREVAAVGRGGLLLLRGPPEVREGGLDLSAYVPGDGTVGVPVSVESDWVSVLVDWESFWERIPVDVDGLRGDAVGARLCIRLLLLLLFLLLLLLTAPAGVGVGVVRTWTLVNECFLMVDDTSELWALPP